MILCLVDRMTRAFACPAALLALTRLRREEKSCFRNSEYSGKALLGGKLTSDELEESLRHFYQYIDLSNDQIFLRQQERVSVKTWENWRDGIKSLMEMPAFSEAWNTIKEKPTTKFDELRRLEASNYQDDPYNWNDESNKLSLTAPISNRMQPTCRQHAS